MEASLPPQLLAKVNPNASFVLLPLPEQRPEVAVEIARCIATWAQAENALSLLFLVLLGGNEVVGSQLYNSFESATAKMSALRSVAITSILPEESILFEALLRLVKSKQKIRDKIVHWLWGVSPEFKDGLILIDPKLVLSRNASYMDVKARDTALAKDQILGLEEHIYIYRTDDLKRDAKAFEETAITINHAHTLFMTPKTDPDRQELAALLADAPLLREFLPSKPEG